MGVSQCLQQQQQQQQQQQRQIRGGLKCLSFLFTDAKFLLKVY